MAIGFYIDTGWEGENAHKAIDRHESVEAMAGRVTPTLTVGCTKIWWCLDLRICELQTSTKGVDVIQFQNESMDDRIW